jgi:hypothetical protein
MMLSGLLSPAALLTGTAVAFVVFVSLGLGRAARRAGLAHPQTLAVSVAAVLVVWLGATAALAQSGLLADWSAFPPRWPLLAITALVTLALLSLTQTFRRLLIEVPPWQLVAIQTFRVGVELAFWRLYVAGFAPVQVTFEGRNFDALVGLTAPVVVAWNLCGLAMLLNAIGTVATSTPGPLHLDWPGAPFTAVAAWPVVWIPALLAPAAIFLHAVSILQSLGRLSAVDQEDRRGVLATDALASIGATTKC